METGNNTVEVAVTSLWCTSGDLPHLDYARHVENAWQTTKEIAVETLILLPETLFGSRTHSPGYEEDQRIFRGVYRTRVRNEYESEYREYSITYNRTGMDGTGSGLNRIDTVCLTTPEESFYDSAVYLSFSSIRHFYVHRQLRRLPKNILIELSRPELLESIPYGLLEELEQKIASNGRAPFVQGWW